MTSPRIERIGSATLHLGDCRAVLPTLQAVDVVVTDPPYGISWKPRVNHQDQEWIDDVAFDPRPFLMIGQEHIFFGGNYFCHLLPPTEAWFIWLKRPVSFEGHVKSYAPCEMIWSDLKGKQRIKTHVWDGGKREGEPDNRSFCHPAQKPVEIMEWCISHCSGKAILDPFMGSGTTGVAAARLGRTFTGIENKQTYFDTACRRLEQAQRQAEMFVQQPMADMGALGARGTGDLFAEPTPVQDGN